VSRKLGLVALAALAILGLAGCDTNASVVNQNLATAGDQFELNRRIIFLNGITDKYIMVIEGRCSIENNAAERKLSVTCKVGDNEYKKHLLGTSDNVTWFMEQLDAKTASANHYRVIFKPETIIPDVDHP
jgi:hypothetical protein